MGRRLPLDLLPQLALEDRSDDFIIDLLRFYRQVGLPSNLKMLGLNRVNDSHLRAIAEFACRPGSRMHNMAFPVTINTALSALHRAENLALAVS